MNDTTREQIKSAYREFKHRQGKALDWRNVGCLRLPLPQSMPQPQEIAVPQALQKIPRFPSANYRVEYGWTDGDRQVARVIGSPDGAETPVVCEVFIIDVRSTGGNDD